MNNAKCSNILLINQFLLLYLFQQIFQFCQVQSERQKVELEDGFAVAVGLKQPKVYVPCKGLYAYSLLIFSGS